MSYVTRTFPASTRVIHSEYMKSVEIYSANPHLYNKQLFIKSNISLFDF